MASGTPIGVIERRQQGEQAFTLEAQQRWVVRRG
jgi:hypothetical protein